MLVVVCGAIVGVAGFAFEQAHSNWRPHVTRTASGWRVTQPVLGVSGPALAGGHLAWQAGPYTIVMDLRSGKTKLVGAAADAQSVEPPVVSSAAVVWVELSGEPHQRTVVYSYDFASRRRQHLSERPTDAASSTSPAVAGATAYWLSTDGDVNSVNARHIGGGGLRPLASGNGLGPFLLADGALVAWSRQTRLAAPFTLTVLDTTSGAAIDLVLPGQSGATFDAPILANATIVWLRIDEQGNETINAYDLNTFTTTRRIVAGDELVGPGFDGTTVVWAQRAGGGSGMVVMGLRLAGGAAFRIADVPDGVRSVLVSGDTVAWCVGSGPRSYVETSRLPR